MRDPASEFPRMILPRTRVNKECKGLQRISLNAQGEAVAEAGVVAGAVAGAVAEAVAEAVAGAVAGAAKTVFSSGAGTVSSSGAGTVSSSGAGTGFSTVTVRAAGRGEAASSRSPPMRSRRAPTRSPISSPTASAIRRNMASPLYPLTGHTLLLPTIPSLRSCRTRSCPAPWSFRSRCSHRVATPRTSYTPHRPSPMGPARLDRDREKAGTEQEGGDKSGPGCTRLRRGAGKVSPRQRPEPRRTPARGGPGATGRRPAP